MDPISAAQLVKFVISEKSIGVPFLNFILQRIENCRRNILAYEQKEVLKRIERILLIRNYQSSSFDIEEQKLGKDGDSNRFWLAGWLGAKRKGFAHKQKTKDSKKIEEYNKAIYRLKRFWTNYSGYCSLSFYNPDTGHFLEGFNVSFGGSKRKPVIGNDIWEGVLVGHEVVKGMETTGKVRIRYNFSKGTISIYFYNINYENCFEKKELFREFVEVAPDGSFSTNPSLKTESIKGNFYGFYCEEASGAFRFDNFSGVFFSRRLENIGYKKEQESILT